MLGAGMNEDLVLSNETKVNEEKGNLELIFKREALTGDAMWDALNANQDVSADSVKIIIWDVNLTTWEGQQKTAGQIVKELQALESQLKQILSVYMTGDKIDKYLGGTKMFVGTVVKKENFATVMVVEDTVKSVQQVIIKNFITACKENDVFDNAQTITLKLVRQSKTKHFPKLPMFGAFIESTVITTKKTGLAWTDYEEKNNLNDPTPTPADVPEETEQKTASSLFDSAKKDVETTIE